MLERNLEECEEEKCDQLVIIGYQGRKALLCKPFGYIDKKSIKINARECFSKYIHKIGVNVSGGVGD